MEIISIMVIQKKIKDFVVFIVFNYSATGQVSSGESDFV